MADKNGFWEQVKFARKENSWTALAANLLFWTCLFGLGLCAMLTGHLYKIKAIIALFAIPLPILHGSTVVIGKLRKA